ncbi:MarR family transcriptional regulator [Burkholderia sp. Nafp2/4-1b]|uniref:MarR family winged helix-turn-helix transcriptional regulator n=1 Tax=Burkholderia sp. Nafp2/4-1b TaxID=2116686 RepID=UPI000EF8E04E|nr:MarR family winged helix-turn-helix transcriptional regulator [Burkholderia sp. Nafp2/4-1b]RKU04799.1 MarR family transcriptional regulator [Burkholderia sp. Nafp2/4-1b]
MTKPAKLTAVALSVFRLNGLLIEWGNTFAAPHGLTSARWQVLGAISLAPEAPNIPQIAEAMGITRQAVLKQINVLTEEGLVQPLPNPTHKRSPLYALTTRGAAAYEAVVGQWQQHVRDISGQFGAADLDAAIRVLSAMCDAHAPNGQA